MLATIVIHECRQLWRDRRLQLAACVVAVVAVAAVVATRADTDRLADAQDRAHADTRRQWEEQDPKNPHSAAHFGTYAFKPPAPLSFLDRGVDAYAGVAVWLEAHKQNPSLFQPATDETTLMRFGGLTAATVAGDVMPLLIIVLGAGLVARDREDGVLRLVLAAGTSPLRLVLGKALALWLITCAVCVIPCLWMSVEVWRTTSLGAPDAWSRWVMWCAAHLALWWIVAAVVVAVSAVATTARQALVASVSVWIIAAMVAPRVAGAVAERRHVLPDGATFWAAVQHDAANGLDGHNPADVRANALRERILRQYGVSRIEDLPINFAGLALQAGEEHSNAVFDHHYGRLWAQVDAQQRWLGAVGWLSPRAAVQGLSMALAGSDVLDHRRFTQQAEAYRRDLNRHLNLAMAYRSNGSATFIGDAAFWAAAPRFSPSPRSLTDVMRDHRGTVGMLVWWVVTACVVLVAAGRRAGGV